jgi:hypothetical protein
VDDDGLFGLGTPYTVGQWPNAVIGQCSGRRFYNNFGACRGRFSPVLDRARQRDLGHLAAFGRRLAGPVAGSTKPRHAPHFAI